jgi:hypothetical protein
LSANFLIAQVLRSAVDMTAPPTHCNHQPARPLWVKSKHVRCNSPCPPVPKSRYVQCNSGCPLGARSRHWYINASGSGPLIVVTGMNVTAVFALEEVHIISLFAPFDSLPELQFAATTRTRARIGTGRLHRTDVMHGGQMAL